MRQKASPISRHSLDLVAGPRCLFHPTGFRITMASFCLYVRRCVEFLKECYERIPQRVLQFFARTDSGFFDGALLDFLEDRHSEYLIKVKMRNLVELLIGQTTWQREKGKTGIETTEFSYQCHGWNPEE